MGLNEALEVEETDPVKLIVALMVEVDDIELVMLCEVLEVAETDPVELMVALMVEVDVIVLVMLEVTDIVLLGVPVCVVELLEVPVALDMTEVLRVPDGEPVAERVEVGDCVELQVEVGDIVPVIEDVMATVLDGVLRRAQTRPLPPMLERVETVPAGQLPDSTQRPEPAATKCAVVGSRKLGNNAQPSLHERQSNCPPAGPHS